MTLPASGTITLAQIQAEFGGSYALNQYYRGGTYVPNISLNTNIPTSGQISLSNFYGASASRGVVITLSGLSTLPVTGIAASTTEILAMCGGVSSGTTYNSAIASGTAWTANGSPGNNSYLDCAFGGSYFIIADQTGVANTVYPGYGTADAVLTGFPGISASGYNGGVSSAAYGAGVYVLAFGDGSMTATNPSTYAGWTYRGANLGAFIGSLYQKGTLKFINNTFVGVSPSSNPFWTYSTTGTSWTAGPVPLTPNNVTGMYDVAFGAGLYVFVGTDTSGGAVWTSPDLTSATITKRTIPFTSPVRTIIWVASVSKFVIATTDGKFASSTNGITWTQFTILPASAGTPAINCGWAGSTFSLFGTSQGTVAKINNADIP